MAQHKQQKRRPAAAAGSSNLGRLAAVTTFLASRSRTIAVVLVAIASLRIAATYPVFNQTFDEPLHIACGVEWLGSVVCADETPPLARVAAAAGPYLLGVRSKGTPYRDMDSEYKEGAAMLYGSHRYDLTLTLARVGILPFFWIACLVVYQWGKRYYGAGVAVVAVFLFSFLPPVLGHAGLATVDMALTAFLGTAFLSALIWVEQPTPKHGVLFGAMTALAILSKYSTLVFFPASAALSLIWYLAAERPSPGSLAGAAARRIPSLALAVFTAVAIVWAGYRFSYGGGLPAPQLFGGIRMVMEHNTGGHYAYLLGQRGINGWWYFYPVVLAVKTPLAFLLLLATGGVWVLRNSRTAWLPLAFSGGILLVGLFSRINIGVRHILPVYVGFSLLAALAIWRMMELRPAPKWLGSGLALLLIWMTASSLWTHPDYLAYFNELAGSRPEQILVDSDLDWGQDMKRLARRLREAGAAYVTFTPFADQGLAQELGFPPVRASDVPSPSPGWNAISLTQWKARRLRLLDTHPEVTAWPDLAGPGERIGRGIVLWYYPPASIPER